jgi:hypothetical protein
MASVFRSRFFRGCAALFFLGAALLVGCYGVLCLFEAFDRHGSPGGNALLFGLGLLLLCFSAIFLIVGLSNWRLAHPSPVDVSSLHNGPRQRIHLWQRHRETMTQKNKQTSPQPRSGP